MPAYTGSPGWRSLVQPAPGSARLRLRLRGLAALLTLVLLAAHPAGAQDAAAPAGVAPALRDQGPVASTLEEIRAQRSAVEADPVLDEATKARALELYDQALAARQQAAEVEARRADLERRIAAAPDRIEAIRKELGRLPEPEPIPDDLSLSELEQRIREREAALAGMRTALKAQEQDLRGLLDAGKLLNEEILDRRRQLERIADELGVPSPADEPAVVTRARDAALKARRALRSAELGLFETRLANLDVLTRLATAERDLTAARVSRIVPRLEELRGRIQAARQAEAARTRRAAERARSRAAELPSALRAIAESNLELSAELERLIRRDRELTEELSEAERELKDLRSDYQRTRQRVDLVGPTEATATLLRRQRVQLPDTVLHRADVGKRREAISSATNRQIEVDESRRRLTDLGRAVDAALAAVQPPPRDEAQGRLREEARDLLVTKRETLTQLQGLYSRYVTRLTALDAAKDELVTVAQDFKRFIDEQLVWMRSTPAVGLDDVQQAAAALAWLVDPGHWARVVSDLGAGIRASPALVGLGVLFVIGLFLARRRAVTRLADIAQGTRRIRTDSFLLTLQGLLWTIVIAAPWPALIALVGWQLWAPPGAGSFSRAIGGGLVGVAVLIAVLRLFAQLCRSDGLGDRHFRWPEPIRNEVVRELRWLLIVSVPLGFLVSATSTVEQLAYVEGLGRPAFVLLMAALALFAYRLFREESALMQYLTAEEGGGWLMHLRFLWFPLLVLAPLALAVVSILGYHYTAVQLERRLILTVWFLLAVLVLRAMLVRWVYITDRRLRLQGALKRRADLRAQREREEAPPEETLPFGVVEEPTVDFEALSDQAKRLLRTGLLLGAIVGTWVIWSELMPALGFLEAAELPFTTTEAVDGITKEVPVTLVDLLMGLLVVVITFLAAKNLPGVLEITLLQRLPLDPGGRYAITSLAQYTIVAIGIIVGFDAIGAEWGKIQWLVAALGVGLGFGLQEIVANFISGIILLFERPIRVGDIVTVGDTSGMVSRIRIRATTIINWDKQELLVPNKEFITGRLLNWTLSDSVNRITIQVGVAHGTDVGRALQILHEIADQDPHVLKEPAPIITFERFGEHALELVLRCYLGSIEYRLGAISDLHQAINRELTRAGIIVAYPQRDLHLDTARPLDIRLHGWDPQAPGGPAPGQAGA